MNSNNFSFSLVDNSGITFLKKLISIALIFILLLNVLGYYGIFLGVEYHHDVAMTKSLDADRYTDSEAVTIKIPLSVPYVNNNGDFERVDGKFQHNGEFYRLVKQKYVQDTLIVVCVKDFEKKRLQLELAKFVKTFSDTSDDRQSHAPDTFSFIKDYIAQTLSITSVTSGWKSDTVHAPFTSALIPTFTASVIHPPERA